MHDVHTPRDEAWECFIEWEGRKVLHQSFRAFRNRREARARKRADNSRLDLLDGCDFGGWDGGGFGVAILFIALLIIFGPAISVALFGVLELGTLILLLVAGFLARTLFRRPWRVVAVSADGVVWAWRQVGWFAARNLASEVAALLGQGHEPGLIRSDRHEAGTPSHLDPNASLGLMANPWFRWTARIVIVAAVCAAIIVTVRRVS